MKRTNLVLLLSGVSALVIATPAASQTAGAPAKTGDEAASQEADSPIAADDPAATGGDQAIVVTGSRIIRNGFDAPTPVTVLRTEDLIRTAPSSIPDALNQLPTLLGSVSHITNANNISSGIRSGNFLNLRALGPTRTLVLQDGRRLAPSANNGATDTNLIPQMLVERVDIVTGGASSAYGSDAVAGVVNFITNTRYNGVTTILQSGIADEGDAFSYKVGIAAGTSLFDDRLHLVGSAERYHSDGIERRTDRPLAGNYWLQIGSGTAASPFRYVSDVRLTNVSLGGLVLTGPLTGRQFVPGGNTVPFNPGTIVLGAVARNGDGAGHDPACCTLLPELTTDQFFGRVTFEATPSVNLFAQVSYSTGETVDEAILFQRTTGQMLIARDNAFLSDATRAQLGAGAAFQVSKSFDEFGPNRTEIRSTGLNAVVGADGEFGNGWKWDVAYVHGNTKFKSKTNTIFYENFYAAIDAVRGPAGNIVCRITLTNPGLRDNCVPLNVFGAGTADDNPSAVDFVFRDSIWETENKMDYGAANLAGDLLELWDGPLSFATGVEYRDLSLVQTTNSDPATPANRTGLLVPPIALSRFYQPNVAAVEGSYNVKEAYVELNVPLFRDRPFAKSLDLNGALRFTDYSTSGTVETWKIGATYEPVPDVRFRGTVSRDIRAPTLVELFAGQTQSTVLLTDPLTGFNGNIQVLSGGNPNLIPERALTYTAGIALNPRFLPGFTASIDYYTIKLEDAVATPFSAAQVLSNCFLSNGTSSICDQIERPLGPTDPSLANAPTRIFLTNQNVASLKVSGIDFELGYRKPLDRGLFSIRILGTRLLDFEQQRGPGEPVVEFAGSNDFTTPLPKWRGNVQVGLTWDDFSINVQERIIGSFKRSHTAVWEDNSVPTVFYTDLNLSQDIKSRWGNHTFFATVNNLFDKEPLLFASPGLPGVVYPTLRQLYDITGRYFTFGFRSKF